MKVTLQRVLEIITILNLIENIMKNIIKERDLKLKKEDPSINTKNSIYAISVPMGGQIKK